MLRKKVDNRICRHASLIHLEEDNLAAVRRPEVIAADIQFLGIDPIHLAVEDVFVFVVSQCGLIATFNRPDIEAVLAKVRNLFAVGRELGIAGSAAGSGESGGGAAIQIVEPELAVSVEKEVLGIGRPMVCGDGIARAAFALTLVFNGGDRRHQGSELFCCDEQCQFSRSNIDVKELRGLMLFAAKNVRDFVPVGTPLDGFRHSTSKAAVGIDSADGELLLAETDADEEKDKYKSFQENAPRDEVKRESVQQSGLWPLAPGLWLRQNLWPR